MVMVKSNYALYITNLRFHTTNTIKKAAFLRLPSKESEITYYLLCYNRADGQAYDTRNIIILRALTIKHYTICIFIVNLTKRVTLD